MEVAIFVGFKAELQDRTVERPGRLCTKWCRCPVMGKKIFLA